MGDTTAPSLRYLVPVAGPPLEPIAMAARPGGLTIGRHERCDLLLPATADGVSRVHARFQFDAGESRWRLSDLNSRWGTFVNGVRVAPGREVPLSDGDLVRIYPWTFGFGAAARPRGLQTADDRGHTMVRPVSPPVTATPRDDMLALLLETAAALHDAPDERRLAERLIDAARRGTGLPNAAVLRPADNAGRVDVVAAEMRQAPGAAPSFSRSLLAAAAAGPVVEMTGGGGAGAAAAAAAAAVSQSIVEMRIDARCACR